MRTITQSNNDELNIGRILMQCSLWECMFHTCKVPRRGDMTAFVFGRIQNLYRIDFVFIMVKTNALLLMIVVEFSWRCCPSLVGRYFVVRKRKDELFVIENSLV